jgi:hypothetical protein
MDGFPGGEQHPAQGLLTRTLGATGAAQPSIRFVRLPAEPQQRLGTGNGAIPTVVDML